MGKLRGAAVLAGFAVLTLPLLPVQAALVRFAPGLARRLPHWYHRQVCRLVGLRLRVEGEVSRAGPVLLVSNHTSWLDISVLSAVAPVSFVAKREVGGWPGVGTLARLQRTVFVDRERRAKVAETAGEIMSRLAAGDTVVLFAEGTTSDGNRVLPFRSSLFAAVKPTRAVAPTSAAGAHQGDVDVQTVALVYTRHNGLSLGRHERHVIGWYGDMEMLSHAWAVLQGGPIDVTVRIGPRRPLEAFADRKALAVESEAAIRRSVVGILRGRDDLEPTPPPPAARAPVLLPKGDGERWK